MKYNVYYRKLSDSKLFINEFLLGLTAQEYVEDALRRKAKAELRKANRKSPDDYHD